MPEMVEMAHQHDMLGASAGSDPVQQADHFGAGEILPLAVRLRPPDRRQREAARAGPCCSLGFATGRRRATWARPRTARSAHSLREAQLQLQAGRHRAGAARPNRPSRPAGGRRGCTGSYRPAGPCCAAPRQSRPRPAAAAISSLLAIEMRLDIARQARRRARQGDHDLPADVEPAIIVEPVARVLEARSRRTRSRADSLRDLAVTLGRSAASLPCSSATGLPPIVSVSRGGVVVGRAAERHLLEPAALLARRLEADRPELDGDIVGGDGIALASRCRALRGRPTRGIRHRRGPGGAMSCSAARSAAERTGAREQQAGRRQANASISSELRGVNRRLSIEG